MQGLQTIGVGAVVMLGMAPPQRLYQGGHSRGEGMFSHALSVTGWVGGRSLNSKAQLWMTFHLPPGQGELVSTPKNAQVCPSLHRPAAGQCGRNPGSHGSEQ